MAPTGLTRDAGWEIGVSRILPLSPAEVWDFLVGPEGLALWLGKVALPTEKGEEYETADGTRGEIRGYQTQDRIRLTWRPAGWTHDTTVQVAMAPSGSGTVLRFHQERLADAEERARQREHWKSALDAITRRLTAGRA
ncbi:MULTISPECIES: SRPBCC family protein [unclassified Streptomyces]|uniref:SRPBCC family protein n=1 Tax=unclassified Streptomyces TaxID=2593676 RepID=UPI002E28C02B|nr:SRPBCC domain-containing protein [Streptomyces sp. NBC_00223]